MAPAHITMAMRESVGLPPVAALLVRAVEDDGPGAAAGIRTGDVLLCAGRRELRSVASLYAAIDDAGTARRLKLQLLRGAEQHQITVRLDPAPGTRAATAGRTGRSEHRV